MTTTMYNRQSAKSSDEILSLSSINTNIENEAKSDEISAFMFSWTESAHKVEESKPTQARNDTACMEENAYFMNKYGDEYVCCDELGFESSHMGPRADNNHIF